MIEFKPQFKLFLGTNHRPNIQVTSKELYESYTQWCKEAGEEPKTQKWVGTQLKTRGFTQTKGGKGVRMWNGLQLKNLDEVAHGGAITPISHINSVSRDENMEKRATMRHSFPAKKVVNLENYTEETL